MRFSLGLCDPSHQGSSVTAVIPCAVWFRGRLSHRTWKSCCVPGHYLTVNSKLLEYCVVGGELADRLHTGCWQIAPFPTGDLSLVGSPRDQYWA